MGIKSTSVTISGTAARVMLVQLHPQPDGSVGIVVSGISSDSEGRAVALKDAQIRYRPGSEDVVARLLGDTLDALRKVNGLEDGPIALEPKADTSAST